MVRAVARCMPLLIALLVLAACEEDYVQLYATRDTVTFGANGLGFGVANSTIVVSIGARAETVVVSRLGRARVSY